MTWCFAKRGGKKKWRTWCRKDPRKASLEEIYLPTSKIKPVQANSPIFLATRRKFAKKIGIAKKILNWTAISTDLGQIGGKNAQTKVQKESPRENRSRIYLPTSGIMFVTFFFDPACAQRKINSIPKNGVTRDWQDHHPIHTPIDHQDNTNN